jgi:hypothetical protein
LRRPFVCAFPLRDVNADRQSPTIRPVRRVIL